MSNRISYITFFTIVCILCFFASGCSGLALNNKESDPAESDTSLLTGTVPEKTQTECETVPVTETESQSETLAPPETEMSEEEKERQIAALSIVTKLFNEYLESFITPDNLDYKITDYVIESITIMDPEFTDRITSSDDCYDYTENAIAASVHFYVKPENSEGKDLWNTAWCAGNGHVYGSWIRVFNVLIADLVDGEYKLFVWGSGW